MLKRSGGMLHTSQGLGFPQLSNMRTLPVFFNMIVQGLMDAPTFAVYLNPNPAAEPAGEVQFGGMNSARFTGAMNWTPVVQKSCAPSSP
jgi:cathepsin E